MFKKNILSEHLTPKSHNSSRRRGDEEEELATTISSIG